MRQVKRLLGTLNLAYHTDRIPSRTRLKVSTAGRGDEKGDDNCVVRKREIPSKIVLCVRDSSSSGIAACLQQGPHALDHGCALVGLFLTERHRINIDVSRFC